MSLLGCQYARDVAIMSAVCGAVKFFLNRLVVWGIYAKTQLNDKLSHVRYAFRYHEWRAARLPGYVIANNKIL
jgi:hypothetical protein